LGGRRPIRGSARYQRSELQVIAAVEGQVLDAAVFDHRPDVGGFGLQHRCTAHHLHHLRHIADFERHINAGDLADLQFDVVAHL
jgi:hypothetical protein